MSISRLSCTDKDNLFMEEIERVATEKYEAIKEKLPNADNETIAILMAINALSVQLSREIDIEKMEDELNKLRSKTISDIKEKVSED
ncbi:hypothetical protein HK319_07550 [Streptococcus agalactiae]|nr:hypothetical protein [Streptococcus agalactiae]